MKIRELAEYCDSICSDCDKCEHRVDCDSFKAHFDEITPKGAVFFIDKNSTLWM